MKIALVSPYDWSYPGGVRTHIVRLAAVLRERGHSVRILTPASGADGRVKEYGIFKFGWAAPFHLNGSVARIAITPDITGKLRRLLEREEFDVVHLHEPLISTLTLAVLRIARDLGITCVGTFHASSKRTSTATWAYAMASPFLQTAFRRLDGYIAVSDAARNYVNRFFPAEYQIVPNGIDIERFGKPRQRLPQFADGKLNVLYLARMEPRKGLLYLLKAIPHIRQSYAGPVRFILAGDGPQRAAFQKYVQRQGWPDVIFTGYITDEEKLDYFASADLYCAPSTGNESQGIVLLEAMAAGVPVVASDIAGYRTVITDPTMGLLTPPRDAERLAWLICHLLRDANQRSQLSQGGHRRALEYSWEAVTTEIEHMYAESQARNVDRQTVRRRLRFLPRRKTLKTAEPLVGIVDTSGWAISPFEENVVE